MKKLITVLVFSLLVPGAFAQNKQAEEVKVVSEWLRQAMISGNRDTLTLLTAADLSYGHSSGHIDSKTEFVDKLATGKSDFVSIDISNQQITLYENTAIVRQHLQAVTNDNGKTGTVTLEVLLVWVKKDGRWQLVARQAVKPNP